MFNGLRFEWGTFFLRLYFVTRTCNSLYHIQLFTLSHTWYCRGYLQLGKLWCKDWVGLFHEIGPLFHFWKMCQASKLDVNPSWSNIWCGLQFKKNIYLFQIVFNMKIFQKYIYHIVVVKKSFMVNYLMWPVIDKNEKEMSFSCLLSHHHRLFL